MSIVFALFALHSFIASPLTLVICLCRVSSGEEGTGKSKVAKSRSVKIGTGARVTPADARASSAIVSSENANKETKVDSNNQSSNDSQMMNLGW